MYLNMLVKTPCRRDHRAYVLKVTILLMCVYSTHKSIQQLQGWLVSMSTNSLNGIGTHISTIGTHISTLGTHISTIGRRQRVFKNLKLYTWQNKILTEVPGSFNFEKYRINNETTGADENSGNEKRKQ